PASRVPQAYVLSEFWRERSGYGFRREDPAWTTRPTDAAARITAGSGAFLSLLSAAKVRTAMTAVGMSTIERLASTKPAPPMAPAAAAVTPATNALTRASFDQRRTLGASRITTAHGGRNTPAAEMIAPTGPATRKPMNPTA